MSSPSSPACLVLPSSEISRAATLLMSAFNWDQSPQGSNYWADLYCRLFALGGGFPAPLASPASPLPVSASASASAVKPDYLLNHTQEQVEELRDIIMNGIEWIKTIEGIVYWSGVYCQLQRIEDAAKAPTPPPVSPETLERFGQLINPVSREATIQRLKDAGAAVIGGGSFGTVWTMPGDDTCVIKMSLHGAAVRDGWPAFVQCVMDFGEDNPHLVKVHRLIRCEHPTASGTFFVALMERLEPFTSNPNYSKDLCDDIRASLNGAYADLPPKLLEAIDVIRDQANEYGVDLHKGNIMWRGDTVVITDPFATSSSEPYSRFSSEKRT